MRQKLQRITEAGLSLDVAIPAVSGRSPSEKEEQMRVLRPPPSPQRRRFCDVLGRKWKFLGRVRHASQRSVAGTVVQQRNMRQIKAFSSKNLKDSFVQSTRLVIWREGKRLAIMLTKLKLQPRALLYCLHGRGKSEQAWRAGCAAKPAEQ